MTTRRAVLAGLAAAALPAPSWAAAGSPLWLAAGREADGAFSLFGIAWDGALAFRVPLPGRGHAAAAHPTRAEAVAFARRPGAFALVIDCTSGAVLRRLDAPRGRHFYGHGAYAEDGRVFVTTENAFETGDGRLGLWDAEAGYRRLGEVSSGGIGPHEVVRLPGGTLAVANGGIRTHPDTGREKLNLPTMRPSLTRLRPDGTILETVELDPQLRLASIRHLAARADGTVAFALQWEGEEGAIVPLLGLHRRGEAPRSPGRLRPRAGPPRGLCGLGRLVRGRRPGGHHQPPRRGRPRLRRRRLRPRGGLLRGRLRRGARPGRPPPQRRHGVPAALGLRCHDASRSSGGLGQPSSGGAPVTAPAGRRRDPARGVGRSPPRWRMGGRLK